MSPLRVVCLISGGKDSLFSILHCLENGDDVVALANLHPRVASEQDTEDLDSYMYQTVGHRVIPLYEKALGLPLYREEIAGSALFQSKSYRLTATGSSAQADETESLVPLLQKVKEDHPEIDAVSTGAILSDYQRTRVESVAIRLGLTPLSYLWQWPNLPPHTQTTLLEDMQAAGQDSRIIKVASGGLDSTFLWCNVADQRTRSRVDKAVKRFGSGDDGAVLGEGGEYETLAVAGPAPLWKGRIEVKKNEMKAVVGEAGSASMSISGAEVVEQDSRQAFRGVRRPPRLEPQFEELLGHLSNPERAEPAPTMASPSSTIALPEHVCYQYLKGPAGKTVAEQMAAIMDKQALSTILQLQNPPLEFTGIAYVSIILRRMEDFGVVNAVYTKAFTEPNPPARVTLAEPSVLSEGHDVMVSFTCVRSSPDTRQGLHVQSQSYWAPANIGPYSQAISVTTSSGEIEVVQRIVYIAGQIPLIPASMELASPEAAEGNLDAFAKQAVLSAQHFVRIGRAMQVKKWASSIAFITAMSAEDAARKAVLARWTWEGLHAASKSGADLDEDGNDNEEGFDVWNVTHGLQRSTGHAKHADKAHTDTTGPGTKAIPQMVVIQVEALPRGASIEWAVYGLTAVEGSIPHIPHYGHMLDVFKARII